MYYDFASNIIDSFAQHVGKEGTYTYVPHSLERIQTSITRTKLRLHIHESAGEGFAQSFYLTQLGLLINLERFVKLHREEEATAEELCSFLSRFQKSVTFFSALKFDEVRTI